MLGVYELPVSSSCQMLLDDMEELMSSIKVKLEMRRRSTAAKQDRIAITKVETTSRLVLIQAPARASDPELTKKMELQTPAARGMFAPNMIPTMLAVNAASPQMICTKPTTPATLAE